jgi:hypothetical protein
MLWLWRATEGHGYIWRNGRRKATAGHGQGGKKEKEGRKAMHQQFLYLYKKTTRGIVPVDYSIIAAGSYSTGTSIENHVFIPRTRAPNPNPSPYCTPSFIN